MRVIMQLSKEKICFNLPPAESRKSFIQQQNELRYLPSSSGSGSDLVTENHFHDTSCSWPRVTGVGGRDTAWPRLLWPGHCSHCTQGLHPESRHRGGSGHILVQNLVTSPVRYSDSYHSHITENGSQIVPCKCLNWILEWYVASSLDKIDLMVPRFRAELYQQKMNEH